LLPETTLALVVTEINKNIHN